MQRKIDFWVEMLGWLVLPVVYGYSIGETLSMLLGLIGFIICNSFWIMHIFKGYEMSQEDYFSLLNKIHRKKWEPSMYGQQIVRNMNIAFLFLIISD